MAAKYYTHFVLTGTRYPEGNEYSGVVELNRATRELEPADIEKILAKNFDLDSDSVTLLSWSRIH